jgi:WD40 repeat protein
VIDRGLAKDPSDRFADPLAFANALAQVIALERLSEAAKLTSRERKGLRSAEAELVLRFAELQKSRNRNRRAENRSRSVSDVTAAHHTVCPYKGLAAYEAADADYFFGREQLVGELVARVVGSSFVGLVGASGSGKSSTLSAGLLPALSDGVLPGSRQWLQVWMRPGVKPMLHLAGALRRAQPALPSGTDATVLLDELLAAFSPAQHLLLVIDQFEEVFIADRDERDRFIELIAEDRPGMKVVLAVRADQYERCAAYPRLARQLAAAQVLVGPLRSEEVAAIVRHPAERVGLRVEPALVEALIAELGTELGAMPLLSTALLELWEAREDGTLTLAAHRATGGVRGAVARLAESAYVRLDPDEQAAARSLFLRLVGEGGDAETIVRRRLATAELETMGDPRIGAVVEKLTEGRLLTRDEGTVEVAHEALIREWPRLREWIEADAAGRQVRLHLIGAVRTWDAGGHEEGDLYRGARLAAALEWAAEREGELNASERDFLNASRASAERAAERQRRTNRILRGLLAGAGVLLLAALGTGAFALLLAGENAENASISQVREVSLSALALIEEDPELALLLAGEAARISREAGRTPPPETLRALWSAYVAGKSTTVVSGVGAQAVAYSPDGSVLAVDAPERDDALVTLRDPSSGEELAALAAGEETGAVQSIAYSPDGRWLAAGTSGAQGTGGGSVVVFDTATEEQVHRFSAGHDAYTSLSWSESGLLAASGLTTATQEVGTLLWDVSTGRERASISGFDASSRDSFLHSTYAHSAALRPGSNQLVLGLLDVVSYGQVGLVGLNLPADRDTTLRCPSCPEARTAWIELVDISTDVIAVSPEGNRVAVADAGRGRVMVVDLLLGGQAFDPVPYHEPRSMSWNREGTLLAVAGGEGVVVLNSADGRRRLSLPSRGEPITSTSFRPGSEEIAGVTSNGALRIYHTGPSEGEISTTGRLPIDIGVTATHVVVSLGSETRPEGDALEAAPNAGSGISVFDRDSGSELLNGAFVVDAGVHGQVAKDSGEVAAIYENGSSVLVEAASFREAARLPGCAGPTGISPDGQYLVLNGQLALGGSCADAAVTSGVYERSSTTPIIDYGREHLRHGAASNETGPGGRRYAAVVAYTDASGAGRVDIWDVETRRLVASIDDQTQPGFLPADVNFSPNGRFLAIGTNGPRVMVIDVAALAEGGALSEATVFDRDVHEARAPKAMVTDAGILATTGADGVYRFWSVPSGEMTMELQVVGQLGNGTFDLSPDYRYFYYEDGGGVIRHIPIDVDEMIELATSAAARTLTDDECRTYLRVDTCPSR